MRRTTLAGIVASVAAAATVIVAGVVWPGLDAQETPEVDTSVWALQTGDGRRYARVNMTIGELDTVRAVSNPSQVVQGADAAYLLSDSNSRLTRIDEALPVDLDEEVLAESPTTPAGTTTVATAGDYVVYLTDSGAVFTGTLAAGTTDQIDPFASADDEDGPQYTADAVAVDADGTLFAYSSADASVIRYSLTDGALEERDPVAADVATPQLTAAGDVWGLLDPDTGEMRIRGVDDPVVLDLAGTVVVAAASAEAEALYVADESSLLRVALDGGEVAAELDRGATLLGTPAVPIVRGGDVSAAWLATDAGVLWRSDTGETPLDFAGGTLGEERRAVFVATGDAVILNETRSGWVWNAADGALIPSSQDWTLDDSTEPATEQSDEQLTVQNDPRPPVAEADAFGVRSGGLVALPVLLNDHDPNDDVLTIIADGVTGLDPEFGSVSVTDDGGRLAVRVQPGATGSATFSYVVSDGTTEDGMLSEPATVTLTVSDGDGAPEWCGVDGCLVEWPAAEVALGGTVTVPVLAGWVDPDGDPLLLLSVTNPSGVGTVASTPGGDVVYQHADDGSGGEQLVELEVTVADTTGLVTTKELPIRITSAPALAVQSFAVTTSSDAATAIDVTPHVTGTAGALSVSSVRVLDDASATATVADGATTFDFSASEPGSYRIDFTVTDGTSDADGTARVTVLADDAPADLATAPVVAFVRPQEDATLDVFAAVSNPTGRVLLISDVVSTATEGASLSVDAVGQSNIRVSGTTRDGGAGLLGTVSYVVTDGTDDAGSSVEGLATVYLLPEAPELAPIAVDDTVVVRAGAQVDIPVLDNDISPAGGRPVLNPASIVSSTDDALAFASGAELRYLAPADEGDYTVDYAVYTTGAPSLVDTATVRIRVLSDESNRAPTPDVLEGRVLSGGTTRIDFTGFGMDPDGDVVMLDSIVTQPSAGVARISADGESIVYSSVAGQSGQVSMRYRVVDAAGATGEGVIRVGVLAADANPSPITFTDYVQVQAGEESTVRVSPLANDIDPTQGSLVLTDVRPDLPETLADGADNPDYARLAARIVSTSETGVVVAAGTSPGTMSFLYDVESDSGNTGRGLIVVKVVRESVPDYPVVSDTVLTVENREDFTTGVDVVAGKATWSGGDVADLEVSLWGEPDGVEVDGWEVSGELPATTRIIPVAISGETGEGTVTTYAFVRVPGDDDLSLSLRASAPAQEVVELESVSFDVADLVAVPRSETLEVGDDVRASGARAEAQCVAEGGTVVRYDAGAGAPWTDACQVPVRLAGSEEWTYVSVPVVVTALDPQPELRAASLTVGPGETTTYDLRTLTSWQLREDWSGIVYTLDYSGAAFEVALDGSIVTVTGADAAVPGSQVAAVVGVSSHTGVAPVRLVLRVGAAPSTLPAGGSVTQQCSQASGSSCEITVIGANGEVNPLPGTPLEVTGVRAVGSCVGVSFRVASATSVVASWTSDAPGATCSATFTVVDAQGRQTAAQRDGRILLDLQGYPKAPASLRQTDYGNGTVTLRVDPGEARQAYPALSGFVIRSGGEVVARCSADGACPVVSAPNGEQREYVATAVNGVGESTTGARTTAWAYDPPTRPSDISWAPVVTSGAGQVVSLSIGSVDGSQTGALEITSPQGETLRVSVSPLQRSVEVRSYRVGTNSASPVTITPISRYSLPPGLDGSTAGSAATVTANGIGAPTNVSLSLSSSSSGDGTSTVSAEVSAGSGGSGSQLRYGIVQEGQWCRADQTGNTATFSGLRDGEEYTFEACVVSLYDGREYGSAEATATVRAEQSGAAPTGYTFVVDDRPVIDGQRAEWRISSEPTSSEDPPRNNSVEFSGYPSSVFSSNPGIQVRYTHDWWGISTPWSNVQAASGSAPYQVQATWGAVCVGGSALNRQRSSSNGLASITFDNSAVRYFDADGNRLAHEEGTWQVPVGAVRVDRIGVTVDWSGQGWGLVGVDERFSVTCDPNLPDPEPDPDPTGTAAP